MRRAFVIGIVCASLVAAQAYSPRVLRASQPDSADLESFATTICRNAGAQTPRQKAEAIWRYFLTDGRFVKPGFWYHIAGWAYEEPTGEVLDPMKLLNSYGFGLCYHVAPLLASVWDAAGLKSRVWFLTAHTVAEVYYDGGWHYYDSDMMGYNSVGSGAAGSSRVASVEEIASDPSIVTGKLIGPRKPDPVRASDPWYPADVHADAIPGLAELFSTANDNWLYSGERSPRGHSMDFELPPGARLIRYFQPERRDLYYLPYQWKQNAWSEFPREIAEYQIRTEDGPRSQKDAREWATGRLEIPAQVTAASSQQWDVRCPWVIIDATFDGEVAAASPADSVRLETSTDDGRTWIEAGRIAGPYKGSWRAGAATLTKSEHGRRTAVSGHYGYLVRATKAGSAKLSTLRLITVFQHNPRTLAAVGPGRNDLVYRAGAPRLREDLDLVPESRTNAVFDGADQGYWRADRDGAAELLFHVRLADGGSMDTVHAGARFLDLSRGMAPDKFTAEVRSVTPLPATASMADIAWSSSPTEPFTTVWSYVRSDDGDRALHWPEADRDIAMPRPARDVYVRYRFRGLAVDSIRHAATAPAGVPGADVRITNVWVQDGVEKTHVESVRAGAREQRYSVDIPSGAAVENRAVIIEASGRRETALGTQ